MDHSQIVHAAYVDVLGHVERSIKAEQMFCSIATQMTFLPQFRYQAELKNVHRENYETSYHRNTAAGNLRRLLTGEFDEMLVLMTVECLIESRKHDKIAETSLGKIVVTDPENSKWVVTAEKWHRLRKRHLKYAAESLRAMIGPEIWAKGALLVE